MAAEPHPVPHAFPTHGLLDRYDRRTTFCFSSPTRILLVKGPHTELNDYQGGTAAELLTALSERGLTEAAVVGAIPFERELTARLLLPSRVLEGPPLTPARATPRASLSARRPASSVVEQERRHFCAAVSTALHEIQSQGVTKVVLSRILDVRGSGMSEVPNVVRRLLRQNAGSYGFAVQLREHSPTSPSRENPVFFGASPELLLSKRGAHVSSHPLAGSLPRASDPDEDRRRAQRLLESEKDSREHACVVQDLVARLGPECRRLEVPTRPTLVATPSM